MNDNVIPLIQPAWKVHRDVHLTYAEVERAKDEIDGLMARCPYPMGAPNPKGSLYLHLPHLRIRLSLTIYSYPAAEAIPASDTAVLLGTMSVAKFTDEQIAFLQPLMEYLQSKGYVFRQFFPGMARSEDTGEENSYHWTFLPDHTGYERVSIIAFVPVVSPYPSY